MVNLKRSSSDCPYLAAFLHDMIGSMAARISEMPLTLRVFLRTHRWRSISPIPWSPLRARLKDSNLALVSTAGFVSADQDYFDRKVKGGDFSFRTISSGVHVSELIESHRSESFDHAGIRADPNLAFPLDRLRELRQEGKIGSINSRHWSFMGSITAPGRLIAKSAPEAAQQAVDDRVDAALLVPV